MPAVSATIVTCNQAHAIGRALASLAWADEIVVVDSGSTDGTQAVCLEHGARVLHRDWDGFITQKNFAVDQASHDWIFSLDSDEEVTPELADRIVKLLLATPACSGYEVNRLSWFLGRWIRHGGWYPDRRIRLWDRRAGRFGGYDPHDDVKVDGRVGRLAGDLLHYPYRDIRDNLARVNTYTSVMADYLYQRGKRGHLHDLLLRPPWTFLRKYVFQRGCLDGFPGLVVAGMAATSVFAKYAKLLELDRRARRAAPAPGGDPSGGDDGAG